MSLIPCKSSYKTKISTVLDPEWLRRHLPSIYHIHPFFHSSFHPSIFTSIYHVYPSIHLAFHVLTGSKSISLSFSHSLYETTFCFYFLSSCSLYQPVNLHSPSLIILISSAQISAGQAAVIFSHTR